MFVIFRFVNIWRHCSSVKYRVRVTTQLICVDISQLLKDCDQKKWLDLLAFVYKRRDTTSMTWRPTSKYVTSCGVKQSTVTCNMDEGVACLPVSVMGWETVFLYCDFSEDLQSWWDRNANESRKRYPSTNYLVPRRSILGRPCAGEQSTRVLLL